MREIILAHKVADSLLECKVNHLIKEYAEVQGAFHLVKIKTVSILLFSVLVNHNFLQASFSLMSKLPKHF